MNLTLTAKERQLLEDQKNHEEICIKKYSDYAELATDPELAQLFTSHAQKEREHLSTINQLLNGTIPNVNAQGGSQQSVNQQASGSGSSKQTSSSFFSKSNQDANTKSDKDLCTDILMTEKFVSSAYNTAIFEFRDSQVREVLNHIQKEEQKHGEAIFQYMQSNGMYNAQ